MTWVGVAADWATLVATVIAIAGAISIWRSRARVKIGAQVWGRGAADVSVSHKRGTAPIRALHFAVKDARMSDASQVSSDLVLWVPEVVEGGRALLLLNEDLESSSERFPNVEEWEVPREAQTVLVALSWQRPLMSWRRSYALVRWDRFKTEDGAKLPVIRGRRAKREWDASFSG